MAEDWVIDETAKGVTDAEHLNGTPWYEARIPRRIHRCTPQTRGWYQHTYVERCACGATRIDGDTWIDRNSR